MLQLQKKKSYNEKVQEIKVNSTARYFKRRSRQENKRTLLRKENKSTSFKKTSKRTILKKIWSTKENVFSSQHIFIVRYTT